VGIVFRDLFPHLFLCSGAIKHIIGNLERQADCFAVFRESGQLFLGCICDNCSHPQCTPDQTPGFSAVNGQQVVEPQRPGRSRFGFEIGLLSAHHPHCPGGFSQFPAAGCSVTGIVQTGRNRKEGVCEQSVASENGGRFAELDMIGRTPATKGIVIHGGKVVVNQRIGMHHFERDRGWHCLQRISSANTAGEQCQHGTETLSAGQQTVAHRLFQTIGTVSRKLRGMIECLFNLFEQFGNGVGKEMHEEPVFITMRGFSKVRGRLVASRRDSLTIHGKDNIMSKTPSLFLPNGFTTAGIPCGIKSKASARDLALFHSSAPCVATGVFTTNAVCGAPVQVSRSRLPSEQVRAVIINAGNANACTGSEGIENAKTMTAALAEQLGCAPEAVLVCSTGVIGVPLPVEKITAGIPQLVSEQGDSSEHVQQTGEAMMTTDTHPKIVCRRVDLETGSVTITGICKGAAMIAPNMATMLAVIMTDVELTQAQAEELLPTAVNSSFNCISVEGHTSTSDSVLLMANGKSDVRLEDRGDVAQFQAALSAVCVDLAQKIVRDAEGAEHFITVDVEGARSYEDAEKIARTVANDVLVKTAITGNDPNWGRIVSACGRTGCVDSEADVSLAINNQAVFKQGKPVAFNETTVSNAMKTGEVVIDITLKYGGGRWRIWTCDLTTEYVRLNSEYTT